MTRRMLIGVVPANCPTPKDAANHIREPLGDLVGLAIPLDGRTPETAEGAAELAQQQNAVLCAYIARNDVVPIGFGACFSSSNAMKAHLMTQLAALSGLREKLAGQVEYCLTVSRRAVGRPASTEVQTGSDHLQRRRAFRDRHKTQAAAVDANLTDLVAEMDRHIVAQKQRKSAVSGRVLTLDLLIERSKLERLQSQLSPIVECAARSGTQIALTGPYPAFSFLPEVVDA